MVVATGQANDFVVFTRHANGLYHAHAFLTRQEMDEFRRRLSDIGNGEVIWADELPATSVDSALEIYIGTNEEKGDEVSHVASQSE